MEEGSSLHPQFGVTMAEACRCCPDVVIASSLRCVSDVGILLRPLLKLRFCPAFIISDSPVFLVACACHGKHS